MTSRGPRMTPGTGVDVDIESGEPLVDVQAARQASEQQRTQEQLAESQAMRIALDSYEGTLLLNRILESLEARVDELIRTDAECQGMLKILDVFQTKLMLGRRAAQRLVNPLKRRVDPFESPLGPG